MLVVLELPYGPADAVERLRPLVAPPSRARTLTDGDRVPLVGEVGLDGVRVRANTGYRNSFAAEAHGRFVAADGDRCQLELQMGTPIWPLLFVAVWFGILFTIGYDRLPAGYQWWEMFTSGPGARHLWLMAAGGGAVCGLGLVLARSELRQIEQALHSALLPVAGTPSSRPSA